MPQGSVIQEQQLFQDLSYQDNPAGSRMPCRLRKRI
jgi:hypothetical protein